MSGGVCIVRFFGFIVACVSVSVPREAMEKDPELSYFLKEKVPWTTYTPPTFMADGLPSGQHICGWATPAEP